MGSKEMKVKDLIRLLWRNILYVILGLVIGAGVGMVVSNLQTPIYDATAKIFVGRPIQQGESSVLLLDDDQLLEINLQLAKFLTIPKGALSQLDGDPSVDDVLITEVTNTTLITIKGEAGSPQRAAALANLFAQTLIQENEKLLSVRYTELENSLQGQIDQVQKQIGSLQSEMSQITDTSIQKQSTQVDQQIEQLQTEISALQQEIAGYPYEPLPRQRIELAAKEAELDQRRALMTLYQQIQTNLSYVGIPLDSNSSPQNPQLVTLQSTLELYQQINASLLNSREDARFARTQARQSVMQIVVAMPNETPVLPLPTVYMLIGGLVGFLLAVVTILIIDHMDESLKSVDEIEDLLGLPVMGFVPASRHDAPPALHSPYSAEAEAFRALGASIEISGAEKRAHTLMVVNAEPTGARTNIAANLAVIHAQQGKRVILLDGDLKQPLLHSIFGLENQNGFAELLDGRANIKNARQVVMGVDGLTLISSGAAVKESTAWLDAARWEQLLLELRNQSDLVIVDSPPADVADAQVLASKMDALLLVVRSGRTRIDLAQATLKRFQLIGARVAGVILMNRAKNQWIFSFVKDITE